MTTKRPTATSVSTAIHRITGLRAVQRRGQEGYRVSGNRRNTVTVSLFVEKRRDFDATREAICNALTAAGYNYDQARRIDLDGGWYAAHMEITAAPAAPFAVVGALSFLGSSAVDNPAPHL